MTAVRAEFKRLPLMLVPTELSASKASVLGTAVASVRKHKRRKNARLESSSIFRVTLWDSKVADWTSGLERCPAVQQDPT